MDQLQKIRTEIKKIVAESLAVEENEIKTENKLSDYAEDSLDMLDIQHKIESGFDVNLGLQGRDLTLDEVSRKVYELKRS